MQVSDLTPGPKDNGGVFAGLSRTRPGTARSTLPRLLGREEGDPASAGLRARRHINSGRRNGVESHRESTSATLLEPMFPAPLPLPLLLFSTLLSSSLCSQKTPRAETTPCTQSSSDEVKALLRRNTDEAIASGAPGVPWIQATDAQGREEYFWGFDHLGQVVRFLGLEGHRFRGPHL